MNHRISLQVPSSGLAGNEMISKWKPTISDILERLTPFELIEMSGRQLKRLLKQQSQANVAVDSQPEEESSDESEASSSKPFNPFELLTDDKV